MSQAATQTRRSQGERRAAMRQRLIDHLREVLRLAPEHQQADRIRALLQAD